MIGLNIKKVSFSYFNGLVLRNVDLKIAPGEMVALLGPNGSGKSTLLKLASGILKSPDGEIWLDGHRVTDLSRKEVARRVATVPQQFHMAFAFTAAEVVLLGRFPFLKGFSGETADDRRIASGALESMRIGHLKDRRFDELSGGERQKVVLAMALAQQPELLLLDEPTAHLDVAHQVEIFDLVRNLNRETGLTVVAAIHDLNLASLYFERLVLIKEGRIHTDGPPAQVLTPETIWDVFGASVRVEAHPTTRVPQVVIVPGECGRTGAGGQNGRP